ncbi:hypothetical protein HJC23_003887 [Cyclotella cryptica]|uniref:Uncharacterized protein n=1 Tax=Cyclotella cryptica TaxID=29204 RepID=A0ABD3PPU8_9STRA|eukprot:CCRYP_013258-RA/>CCRYP_013258-RA protein AED:0.13 eAED:0.13 QI:0/-1/0/1/-1/1/1/0/797
MSSSNHRKSRASVHPPPPPPRRAPLVPPPPPSMPQASSHKPVPLVKLDGRLYHAFPPPPRTNKRNTPKNVLRNNSLPGPSASGNGFGGANEHPLNSIDDSSHPPKEVNIPISTCADSSVDTGIYSANFRDILNKADTTKKDAENMLKLLKMARHDRSLVGASAQESDSQDVDPLHQESLDRELEGLTYFPTGTSGVSSCENPPQSFEALKMLYGEDSFVLMKDPSVTCAHDSLVGPGQSASGGAPLLSDRQLTALFAMDSSFLEEIDPTSSNERPQAIRDSSSGELLRSGKGRMRSKSRDSFSREARCRSPLPRRLSNALLRKESNCSADGLQKLVSMNDPSRRRDRLMRSRSCEPGFDSKRLSDIAPSPQPTLTKGSVRSIKANPDQIKRTSSEGLGARHKVVPEPPTQTKKKSHTVPLGNSLTKRRTSNIDKTESDDVHCLSDSYAKMLTTAQRMSSNRSLGEPSILESPTDAQHLRGLRSRSKSKKQTKGRGHSIRNRTASRDTYDSCGEMSGAEASQISQNSRKSKSKRLMASQQRKPQHQKRKQEMIQKKSDLTQSSRRYQQQFKEDGNQSAASSANTKKSGIAAFLKKNKDRCSNSLGTAATGSTDYISTSLSTTDSRSHQSIGSRKSIESGRSKKSIKSILSSKLRVKNRSKKDALRRASSMGLCSTSLVRTFEREESLFRRSMPDPILRSSRRSSCSSMGSGSILSAAADIFQHQSIPVDINKPFTFDDASSCSSSLSCYSDDESDFDEEYLSQDNNLMPMLASVAEAVDYINGQNKIEKFVSKVKHFL